MTPLGENVKKSFNFQKLKWVPENMYTFSIASQIVNVYKFSGTHFIKLFDPTTNRFNFILKIKSNGIWCNITLGFLQQYFYFTVPYATTKIRLDEFVGDPVIAFSVEFIGLNNEKRNQVIDPLEGGYAVTSKQVFFARL